MLAQFLALEVLAEQEVAAAEKMVLITLIIKIIVIQMVVVVELVLVPLALMVEPPFHASQILTNSLMAQKMGKIILLGPVLFRVTEGGLLVVEADIKMVMV